MFKTPNDAQPTVIPMAEVAVSTGDNDPFMTDDMAFVEIDSEYAEPQGWIVLGPRRAVGSRRSAAMSVPETTYLDTFCDLWASFEEFEAAPLDFGYGARLRDALRIRGDFGKAMARLGLRERKVHE